MWAEATVFDSKALVKMVQEGVTEDVIGAET
jgi:hypothetical protein